MNENVFMDTGETTLSFGTASNVADNDVKCNLFSSAASFVDTQKSMQPIIDQLSTHITQFINDIHSD
jgi:hypothetical protein